MKYQKIQTLWKRNEKGLIIPGEYTYPAFAFINYWEVYEKIHGQNIRIIVREDGEEIRGRTDRAQLHPTTKTLLDKYKDEARRIYNDIKELVKNSEGMEVILYGEGVSKYIQKTDYGHGENPGFYLFDIGVVRNNGELRYYLYTRDAYMFAEKYNIPTAPYLGRMSIDEIVDLVKKGFVSKINNNTQAEGIVARRDEFMLKEWGQRVIFKLKTSDYEKLKNINIGGGHG